MDDKISPFSVDKKFKTAKKFIQYILEDDYFTINDYRDTCSSTTSTYIFRGQPNSEMKLTPSVFRSNNTFDDHSLQAPNKGDRNYLGRHLKAEEYSVFKFLEYADSVGIESPIDYSTSDIHSKLLTSELNNKNHVEFNNTFPDPKLHSAFAFAQHYGVPTRLLDWSESPFIAAYFAAQEHVLSPNDKLGEYFSIFCLSTQLVNNRNCENLCLVKAPRASNHFLQAQRGIFTLNLDANNYYKTNGCWPSIEDNVSDIMKVTSFSKRPLIKLSLPSTEAINLLRILYKMNITKLTLMPSLANAALDFQYRKKLFSGK